MPEPLTIAGAKVSTLVAMAAGSGVSGLLMPGPWYMRLTAGLCGAVATYVGTPILAPIAIALFGKIYGYFDVPIEELSKDGVIGFCGFLLGLTGIDICRWLIDRVHGGLEKLRWPTEKKKDPPVS